MTCSDSIILIGMPGAGKSTVGPLVAGALGWAYVDLDRVIEAGEGAALPQLVARHGPAGFIELEGRYLAAQELDRTVLATGGSAVYHADLLTTLSRRAVIVCLTAPPADLEASAGDLGQRAVVSRGATTFAQILAERQPLMARLAHVSVDRAGKSPREVADEVLRGARLGG
jgi:shikimate kinase